jgi:transmembrane sensor
MKPLTPGQRIDEEASHWAARLDGSNLTDSDQAALSAWLKACPEHRSVFEHYRELSDRIGTHVDARLGEAVETVVRAQTSRRKWRRALVAPLATAAAIAVLFTVLTHRSQVFTTKTGERHMATLDDGSQVELNARTALIVAFSREERHVQLVSGEALFTVSKDKRRPFVVDTPTGSVRVTGTIFDVRAANAERVEVTVLEGTVRVRPAGETTHEQPVTAGLQAVLSENNVTLRTLPDGSAQDVIAWRQGQVVFNDTPLVEAIERIAAYHARTINVEAKAANFRLGGRYSLDDLNGLLESIEGVLPVRVSHQPDGSIRITAVVAPE